MCVMVCSYGAIQRSVVGGKAASKCDLCIGEEMPVCVAHCPNEALVFVEETESKEKV
jgi:carbon-monoxide dehydrogenase iron sulfur subunit